ncbi:MAG: 3-oxoadipate enol-lactonase [Betaproteobacteria bacterium]|nr:3-oxoadipate enol-lactonase [Betaproteobacteria bacterium]
MLTNIKINTRYVSYEYLKLDPKKSTLVFINSLGTDHRIWSYVVEELGHNFNILKYDKQGHGLSEQSTKSPSISQYADDLIALISLLSINQVIPVGLSIGGLIAQELYRKRPDMVEKLVLTNTATVIGSRDSWNQRIQAVERNGLASISDLILSRWFGSGFADNNPDRLAIARAILLQTPNSGYMAACQALSNADLTAYAPNIEVPTLCIAGADDQATPTDVVIAMANLIPKSEFYELSGVGHIPCLEAEQEFSQVILNFLGKSAGADS